MREDDVREEEGMKAAGWRQQRYWWAGAGAETWTVSWAARVQELGSHAQDFDDDSKRVLPSSTNEILHDLATPVDACPIATRGEQALGITSRLMQCSLKIPEDQAAILSSY